MRKYLFIFAAFHSLLGCNNQEMQSSKKKLEGDEQPPNSNTNLIGYWRYEEDDFVSMIISKDSIDYPDQLEKIKYKTSRGSIILFDDESSDTIEYSLRGKDTLILNIAGDGQVYSRSEP